MAAAGGGQQVRRLAGLRRQVLDGIIHADERVVCVLTGSGFKDFDLLASRVKLPQQVIGNYEEMEAAAAMVP